jgi:hypothetical protein
MIKKYSSPILVVVLVAANLLGCGDGGNKGKKEEEKGKVEQTKISYKINLEDSKKTKEDSNKVYYEVPLNTEVIITATVVGPEKVKVLWNQTLKIKASMPNTTDTTWQYNSNKEAIVEVSGKPSRTNQVNGVDLIVNEEKIFCITWKK